MRLRAVLSTFRRARGALSTFPLGARSGSYLGGRAPIFFGSVCRTLGERRGRTRALAGVCGGEQPRVLSDRAPDGAPLPRGRARGGARWLGPMRVMGIVVRGEKIGFLGRGRRGPRAGSARDGEVRRDMRERSPVSGRASSEPYPAKYNNQSTP